MDYSEPMLRKAHERVAEHKLAHVEALAVMDAQQLGFPDAFFDAVVAQYVITTVPDPEAALDEFVRVTRPGGEIILVNHLGAEAGLRRAFEQGFAPVARRLGWRPEFRWQRLAQWAAAPRRRARGRAPRDAAARAFLADPVRAGGGGGGGGADRGRGCGEGPCRTCAGAGARAGARAVALTRFGVALYIAAPERRGHPRARRGLYMCNHDVRVRLSPARVWAG